MKNKRFIIIYLLIIVLTAVSSVNAEDQLAKVTQKGILKFGTSSDSIPFVYYDNDGNLAGIDIELVKEIAKRMNVKVNIIDMAFDGLIDAVDVGQVDLIGGCFSKTKEREQYVDFTNVYYSGTTKLIIRKGTARSIPTSFTNENMRGLTVGVEKGTQFDQWVQTQLVGGGYIGTSDVYKFSNTKQMMNALKDGEVDVVFIDSDTYLDGYQKSGKFEIFADNLMKENYAFATAKDSTLLLSVNKYLTEILQDGTAQKIANKYFSMDFSQTDITPSISRPSEIQPVVQQPLIPSVQQPAQQSCRNAMAFLADITIPDGSSMRPGQSFTKTWRIYNNGSCTWTSSYSMSFVSGTSLGNPTIQIYGTVAPGQSYDISVPMTAPAAYGYYQTNWQMRGPAGKYFGQTIYAKINVNNGYVQPAPNNNNNNNNNNDNKPQPEIMNFSPDFYSGNTNQCPTVTWNVHNCRSVKIFINGNYTDWSSNANDSKQLCNWNHSNPGTYTIQLQAYNGNKTAYAQFNYTVTGDNGGWTIGTGASPNNTGIGNGAYPSNTGIGNGAYPTNGSVMFN